MVVDVRSARALPRRVLLAVGGLRAHAVGASASIVRRAACRGLPCVLGALASTVVHAQRPEPTLGQLSHTAWTIRDGAPGSIKSLAQAADGVLWLGTYAGLYRFDGVRFERFEPTGGQAMLSLSINRLLALPDGALWVGYSEGGASVLANGGLVHLGEREGLPRGTLTAFARDSAGGLWAATTTGLARLAGDRWHRVGAEHGFPGGMTANLLVDRRGTLWAAALVGVYVLPRGARRFAWRAPSLDGPGGAGTMHEAPDGSVWGASWSRGLVRLSDSAGGPPPHAAGGRHRDHHATALLVDRQANAWVRGDHHGVVRVPLAALSDGRARVVNPAAWQTRSRAEGLSGNLVLALLEDREGSMWVGTDGGLDRFRATKLTPVVGTSFLYGAALAAADGGAVWAGTYAAPLVAIGDGVVPHRTVPAGISCAYRDREGGVWLGGPAGLWHGRGGTFTRVALPADAMAADVQAIAADRGGGLWLSVRGNRGRGVLRRRGGRWARFGVAPGLREELALALAADTSGRIWLGYRGNRVARVTTGSISADSLGSDAVRVFSAADGLRVGTVKAIHVRGDRVWVGGDEGVAVLDGATPSSRFRPFTSARGTLRGISGIVETAEGELWLNGADGVTRVAASEVRRAIRAPDHRVLDERFDFRDGVTGQAPQVRPLPSAVEGTDGRLWFSSESGVAWVDPRRLRRNPTVPPVQIRALAAGGRRYAAVDRLTLPAGTNALDVEYTALSLAVPDRVRFRYQLVGSDTGWQDAGTRRHAIYTNLRPGSYRFRVIASNEDEVWNRTGAALDVMIPPTFVQTSAFLALCVATGVGGLWLLVQWRHRRVARMLQARFEATLAERTRIARELHDTLLGEIAGLAMRLDAAATRAAGPGGEDATLAQIRDQAYRTLSDARRSVTDLRDATSETPPVSALLADAARRIFADSPVDARVEHEGLACSYSPDLEAEVLRIVVEALTNACKHAGCRTVVATCTYGRHELRIRVRDDGRGFVPASRPPGDHWGLVGMRERAATIGAQLTIESGPGRGTDVLLVVRARPRATGAAH